MNSITYKTDTDDIEEILNVHEQGGKVLCPICNSELLVLSSWEAAAKYDKRPGIYCLISESHVFSTFLLADRHDEVWRRFEQQTGAKRKPDQTIL